MDLLDGFYFHNGNKVMVTQSIQYWMSCRPYFSVQLLLMMMPSTMYCWKRHSFNTCLHTFWVNFLKAQMTIHILPSFQDQLINDQRHPGVLIVTFMFVYSSGHMYCD